MGDGNEENTKVDTQEAGQKGQNRVQAEVRCPVGGGHMEIDKISVDDVDTSAKDRAEYDTQEVHELGVFGDEGI